MPKRSKSEKRQFIKAGEAVISRFYGGIHYMPSIINGFREGEAIGNFIVDKLKMRKGKPVL